MIGSKFNYFTDDQIILMKNRVFELLSDHGVKLDPHPEFFDLLAKVGAEVEKDLGIVARQVVVPEEDQGTEAERAETVEIPFEGPP